MNDDLKRLAEAPDSDRIARITGAHNRAFHSSSFRDMTKWGHAYGRLACDLLNIQQSEIASLLASNRALAERIKQLRAALCFRAGTDWAVIAERALDEDDAAQRKEP